MADFSNREEFEIWLDSKPRDWAVVLAARSALRVLPMLAKARQVEEFGSVIVLPVVRALALAWAAATYPAQARELAPAAATATNAATAAARASSFAAAAAAAAAAAVDAVDAAAARATTVAAATTTDDASSFATATAIWEALQRDGTRLENGTNAAELARLPLWADMKNRFFDEQRDELRQALSQLGGDWNIWRYWYDSRLEGWPSFALSPSAAEDIDLRIARQDNEWWKRGSDAVNADIAEWVAEAQLKAAQSASLGADWIENNQNRATHLTPAAQPVETDAEAAHDPVVVQLHNGLKRRLQDFENDAVSIDEDYGWDGFNAAYLRLVAAVNQSTEQIPSDLGTVYETSLDFAKFLEQDNWLRQQGQGNVSALSPQCRRRFESIVEVLGPWVRKFPTARQLDEELGGFLGSLPDLMLSRELARAASQVSLISDNDRDLLLSLLAEFEGLKDIGSKAKRRGLLNVQTLTMKSAAVVLAFVSGAIASDYSGKSVLVQRAGDFLAGSETQIVQSLDSMPADIRQAILIAIERAKHLPNSANPVDGWGLLPERREEDSDT